LFGYKKNYELFLISCPFNCTLVVRLKSLLENRGRDLRIYGVFGWLQADTVAAVWIAAAAIHREKNTVEAAAAAGLQPQQAAANKLIATLYKLKLFPNTHCMLFNQLYHTRPNKSASAH
jgi:hypothetical protein